MRLIGRNGAKLKELRVIEHTIIFDQSGWADGSLLSLDEIKRLKTFHFSVREVPDEVNSVLAEPEAVAAFEQSQPVFEEKPEGISDEMFVENVVHDDVPDAVDDELDAVPAAESAVAEAQAPKVVKGKGKRGMRSS